MAGGKFVVPLLHYKNRFAFTACELQVIVHSILSTCRCNNSKLEVRVR